MNRHSEARRFIAPDCGALQPRDIETRVTLEPVDDETSFASLEVALGAFDDVIAVNETDAEWPTLFEDAPPEESALRIKSLAPKLLESQIAALREDEDPHSAVTVRPMALQVPPEAHPSIRPVRDTYGAGFIAAAIEAELSKGRTAETRLQVAAPISLDTILAPSGMVDAKQPTSTPSPASAEISFPFPLSLPPPTRLPSHHRGMRFAAPVGAAILVSVLIAAAAICKIGPTAPTVAMPPERMAAVAPAPPEPVAEVAAASIEPATAVRPEPPAATPVQIASDPTPVRAIAAPTLAERPALPSQSVGVGGSTWNKPHSRATAVPAASTLPQPSKSTQAVRLTGPIFGD